MQTILLVEDDVAVSAVIGEHLVQAGFHVIAAPDTATAADQLEAGSTFDLLLIDLVMPSGMPDGLAFANRVRAQSPGVPLLLMTGYYGFVARAGALPGKILYKPIDLDILTQEIRSQFEGSDTASPT